MTIYDWNGERYVQAEVGVTQRLDYAPAAPPAVPQKPRQLDTSVVLAVGLAVGILVLVMRMGAIQEANQPHPRDLPGWAQSGYYDHSFNGSFNDNSWHWDFCAGYCPR
jgi:hypothetical protein